MKSTICIGIFHTSTRYVAPNIQVRILAKNCKSSPKWAIFCWILGHFSHFSAPLPPKTGSLIDFGHPLSVGQPPSQIDLWSKYIPEIKQIDNQGLDHWSISGNPKLVTYRNAQKWHSSAFLGCFGEKFSCGTKGAAKMSKIGHFYPKTVSLFKNFGAFGAENWITYRFWSFRFLGRSPLFDLWYVPTGLYICMHVDRSASHNPHILYKASFGFVTATESEML